MLHDFDAQTEKSVGLKCHRCPPSSDGRDLGDLVFRGEDVRIAEMPLTGGVYALLLQDGWTPRVWDSGVMRYVLATL